MSLTKKYDLILRPHHVKSFIDFESKKLFLLTSDEYLKRFKFKNSDYHNDEFIIYWKNFLTKLHKKPNLKFKYLFDYDTVCKNCDLLNECEKNNSELHKLVINLDEASLKNFSKLVIGNIYKISFLGSLTER